MIANKILYAPPLLLIIVVLFMANMVVSCGGNPKIESQLSMAESLIIEHPDSAIAMLVYMDTTRMSEGQRARQELLYAYTQLVYGNQIPLDSASIANGDKAFIGAFDRYELKWLLLKSAEAKRNGNHVSRLEMLKDAEFLAVQLNDSIGLGVVYLFLANVYEQGYNGTVSKYYADKALAIFNNLKWQNKIRDARMAIVGAYASKRDYKPMLDSLIAMEPEVMANAHDGYKMFFLDELARGYDSNGLSQKAIEIWHSIYDGKEVSANTLAHWAHAYYHIDKLDSAYVLIRQAIQQACNYADKYLCLNVEYDILEKMGRKQELVRIDSMREAASNNIFQERKLEESSLALNIKYDSTTRQAWLDSAKARNRMNMAIFTAIFAAVAGIGVYIFLKNRNRLLRLEHESDLLKIRAMQNNLFESDIRNKVISTKISELFHTRFKLIDGLAATYFECKDTGQEQKRIYADFKSLLTDFVSKQSTQELTDIVNGHNDNLMDKFRTDFPKLSAAQYRLALYLFCGFSLQSISVFTGTELRNIYVYKSRLKYTVSKSGSPWRDEYLGYF